MEAKGLKYLSKKIYSFRLMTISPGETGLVVGPQAQVDKMNKKAPRILSPSIIFSILLVPRLLAAQYSIIGDCDEGIESNCQAAR